MIDRGVPINPDYPISAPIFFGTYETEQP